MDFSDIARVEGPNLRLRLIEPDDADYVHGLRIDPRYNTHLSVVSGTVEDQRLWIKAYKSREADAQELYYVIERTDGTRCGLVRLYGVQADRFTWGSWVLDDNKPPKAALESAVLSFGIGFENLGCKAAHVDVRIQNSHAEAFYRRLGMVEQRRTGTEIFFQYHRARFLSDRDGFIGLLKKEANHE